MTFDLLPGDYVVCGLTLVMAVTGLFRGLSGTLGFALGIVAAVAAAYLAWPFSERFTEVTWMRAAGTLVVTLLAFGSVRALAKRCVNRLLAQPSDALFGCAIGAGLGVLLLAAWAHSGFHTECSNLARELLRVCPVLR